MLKTSCRALIIGCALLSLAQPSVADQVARGLDWPAIQARMALVAEEFDVPQAEIERAMADPHGAGLADLAWRHDLSLDWVVSGDALSGRVSRTGSTR